MSRVMAVAAMLAAIVMANAANAADKLVLQLNGPAQFEFAGYFAALWQGFYKAAGLDVEIKPASGQGKAAIDPAREVTEGRAQFGVGTAALVVRAAQGQPLLLLAPIFQRSGAGVFYRADEDYASPGALAKATIGRLPASNILDIELATALKAEGIDPDKVNSVPLEPEQALGALADKTVDAVPGSAWELPWLAHEEGFAVKSFNPADYRVEFYGDTLFTLRRFAAAQPRIVRDFRAASLKGWDYALRHPDEVATRLLAEMPHPPGIKDAAGFDHYQAELAVALARFPSVALGHSNLDRWNRIEASIAGVGGLLRTADAEDFVYDPDAAARRRADRRALVILAAALLVAVAVTAWFWRRSRGRPVAVALGGAPADPAAGQPVPAIAPAAADLPAPAMPPPVNTPPPAPAMPAVPPPADLNAVLSRLDRVIRQRVPRGSTFRLSLLPELWPCRADPRAVRGLVLDLVVAAAADLKAPGELIVGTRNFAFDAATVTATPGAQLGDYARLTVRDNGPGLAEEALARILDAAASARPAAAAAAQAMRLLGGFVRVESVEGVGTAVHLYFPRVTPPAERGTSPQPPADAAA